MSFGGFWGLVYKSGLRILIRATEVPFLVTPKWGCQKWRFGCPNQNSETTFQYKLAPKTSKKDTLGTQIGPRKVIFGHFAFFEYFYLIFFEHSLSTGRIFQMQTPSSKSTFFWVKLFFPGFLMYRPSWIFCYLSIRPFFILGPRPNGHSFQKIYNIPCPLSIAQIRGDYLDQIR